MSHIPYYGQPDMKTHMPSGSKNGYEIRAEILACAQSFIQEQARLNIEYARKMHELGIMQTEEYLAALKPYTMKDVLDKAAEMYKFVTSK